MTNKGQILHLSLFLDVILKLFSQTK